MIRKNIHSVQPATIFKDPIMLLAFGFGAGLAKKAPGTWGTLVALPLYWLLSQHNVWVYVNVTLLICVLGVFICGKAAEKLGVHDHSGIVWDEIAGYLVTMVGIPFAWKTALLGFMLFRLFDILKPWPISWLDRSVQGGLGIMVDDLLAGIVAALLLHVCIRFVS